MNKSIVRRNSLASSTIISLPSNSHPSSTRTGASGNSVEILKSLVPCASVAERNLLTDASKIVEKGKIGKDKDGSWRIMTDNFQALREYEYMDVIITGDWILVVVDFRSEFKIIRSTNAYHAVLQSLPSIFAGKSSRRRRGRASRRRASTSHRGGSPSTCAPNGSLRLQAVPAALRDRGGLGAPLRRAGMARFVDRKSRYDPMVILAPGQRIFRAK